ncbi:hypothetical protein N2K95_08785 [Arthrobacter zhaoxinii]|uniref:Uncharacterized protein n=1 Tax=Arthrobacter zhaoxinii TaxID=2964616 RepID=A0ABY5YM87_9MICC|nr:hypothetical protein [Arthrobacter zhaoxinii]UWX95798.1 hypothetical protein N2K95_08785 [Arthrobacter zhaoxinii]
MEAAGQDDAAPVLPDSETTEIISSSVEEGSVEVSRDGEEAEAVLDGGSDGIELTLGLPTPEYAEDAEVQDDGTAIYMDPEGIVDVGVQTLDDGSVRVLTVINDEIAPGRYDYQIDVEDGVVLELTPEGAVALKGADGSSQGMILPAWAEDAAGNPVETHYEMAGNTVTQIVDHNAPGVVYPVVADPKVYYAWWQLFKWSEWRWSSAYRSNQLSMQLSAWGRHDVIFAAGQFVSSGWNLLKQKHPSWIFTSSMRQQWECHVLGGIAEWGTFDLEINRPSLPNWRKRIGMRPLSATCNW